MRVHGALLAAFVFAVSAVAMLVAKPVITVNIMPR